MPARLFLLVPVLLLAVGCEDADRPAEGTRADDLGRELVLEGSAARVVSLAPNVTELAFAAGAGSRIVGVTTADDHPPDIDGLPRIQALPVDFEAVVALAPDLALASDQVNNPRDAETLAELEIPTYFTSIRSLSDVPRVLRDLGALLGTPGAANRAADSLVTRLRTLSRPDVDESDRPRTLFLIDDERLFAFGPESYVHDMIDRAGGRSLTETLDTEAPVLSEEFVIAAAPDVIVGAFGEDYDPSELLRKHPAWGSVPAIVEGRVHGVDPDLFLRPGPRLVEGVARLREILAPEGPAGADGPGTAGRP